MSTTANGRELATRVPQSTEIAASNGDMHPQVAALFARALEQGESGVGALRELMELQDKMQRRRAELDFSLALAEFQAACPAVKKSSTAKITTASGGGYSFTFADLEEIITTVRPVLSANGFSFTFDSETDGKLLKCICTLRHAAGHSMTSSFTLPTENKSGASDQQKVGGALTYAKRQCLISVLGLALTDPEQAGPQQAQHKRVSAISDEQAANIVALLDETGVTVERFCARFKVASVSELPVTLYAEAVRLLEAKRKESSL